jgi:hypothetical protein
MHRKVLTTLVLLVMLAALALLVRPVGLAKADDGCGRMPGPLTTRGNHMYDVAGQVYTPTGITVFGMAEPNYRAYLSSDLAQIRQMADSWCANTVRIQAAPGNLYTNPDNLTAVNPAFVSVLNQEVTYAWKLGLNVVLTAQTEKFPHGSAEPTMRTAKYWAYLGRYYQGKQDLIFDIFNEPRYLASTTAQTWNVWRNGDPHLGYIGMNTLVDDIRADGVRRLLWVEGPDFASTLARVPAYAMSRPFDVVYDIHHPAGPHTAQQWTSTFGTLARTAPVVIGEWAQYATPASVCWRLGAGTAGRVSGFLAYLRQRQIGLIAWTLKPGVLVTANGRTPTTIGPDYACTAGAAATQSEGAGALLRNWFHAVN